MEWASSWLFIAPLPQVLYLLRGLCTCCLSGGTVQWCTWQLSMHLRTWGASSPSTLSAPDLHTESGLVPAAHTGDLRLEQIGIWVNNHKTNDYARYTHFQSQENHKLERFLDILNWLKSSCGLFCKIEGDQALTSCSLELIPRQASLFNVPRWFDIKVYLETDEAVTSVIHF